jgi:hypothetical protein
MIKAIQTFAESNIKENAKICFIGHESIFFNTYSGVLKSLLINYRLSSSQPLALQTVYLHSSYLVLNYFKVDPFTKSSCEIKKLSCTI